MATVSLQETHTFLLQLEEIEIDVTIGINCSSSSVVITDTTVWPSTLKTITRAWEVFHPQQAAQGSETATTRSITVTPIYSGMYQYRLVVNFTIEDSEGTQTIRQLTKDGEFETTCGNSNSITSCLLQNIYDKYEDYLCSDITKANNYARIVAQATTLATLINAYLDQGEQTLVDQNIAKLRKLASNDCNCGSLIESGQLIS